VAVERDSSVHLHLHAGVGEAAFVAMYTKRGATLLMPRRILPAVPVNMLAASSTRACAISPSRWTRSHPAPPTRRSTVMHIHPLSERLSVTAQIDAADIGALCARGFRSIINNRPDGEADDQPTSAALAAAALRHGLSYRHIPVVSGQVFQAQIDAFSAALAELPPPVLAFCRTGTRSSSLWALQEAGSADQISRGPGSQVTFSQDCATASRAP